MEAIGISGVFLAGIVSFFSPCILPVIPVFISTLLGGVDEKASGIHLGRLHIQVKPLLRVIMFVLGLSTSFILLGFAFGTVGMFVNQHRNTVLLVSGIIVILFGIYQTGIIKIPFLMKEKKLESKREKKGMLGAYILGFTFSFGWTPCVGPILGAVLALSASQGGAVLGMVYMAVYSLGLLIPFLVFTIFSNLLVTKIRGIYKYMNIIKIVGGIIIIIMGVFLLTNSLHVFT